MTKTELLPIISIQYQAENDDNKEKCQIISLKVHPIPNPVDYKNHENNMTDS